jgi:hypothetical protein
VSVDKDLISGQPDFAVYCRGRAHLYALIYRIQFVRFINVSEFALAALQVLQLNPHTAQKAAIIGD